MNYSTFVNSLAPAELRQILEAWRRASRRLSADEAEELCRTAEAADFVGWTSSCGECLSWICAADGKRLLVWSPTPIHDGCDAGNFKNSEVRVLVQSNGRRYTPAYRRTLLQTITGILKERDKQYHQLSARGKRLYNELRRLYPNLPLTTVEMYGPVIYTALNDFDFEIYGGYYGRTIKCCPWLLDKTGHPIHTTEFIEIPSKDATFAAHKIREIVEKYRNMEDELDEEAVADDL